MNVEIGAEASQFPEKEYINGIAVAVYMWWPGTEDARTLLEDNALPTSRVQDHPTQQIASSSDHLLQDHEYLLKNAWWSWLLSRR
jgi:hypothetical protein